ncbi:MAG: DUF1249 domain-containing protein [Ectothiorhodospira sp.]
MLVEAHTPAYLDPLPSSFAALMDLYEANYIRLRQLCPDPRSIQTPCISHIPGAMDLHLQVLECCPYTTTLCLTYRFEADGERPCRRSPNLRVRLYHDARQAEVLGRHSRSGEELSLADHPDWKTLQMRWRFNRFLYKWLGYCLRQGHRFD